MNQPTKEEFEELKERVKRLEQEHAELKGQTEPIKVTRLEIDSGGMQELLVQANKKLEKVIQTQADRRAKFDTLEHGLKDLKQELYTLSHNWLDTLQENVDEIKDEVKGTRADIANLRATQSDHGELLKEHTQRLGRIEATMATKDDVNHLRTDMTAVETRLRTDMTAVETRLRTDMTAMETHLIEAMKMLFQQRSGE